MPRGPGPGRTTRKLEMKTFTGTKTVNAKPMNRLDYNRLRGWALPANEDGADEGYLVEYTDGGKPNHPDFAGYISWSPKAQFDRAYLAGEHKTTVAQDIEASGKTAPRVTPDHIKANIVSEHFFTAAQGDAKALEDAAFSGGALNAEASRATPAALTLLTFCVLVLRNGFTVTGESACASPENFDEAIGRRIAKEQAISKVWPLMGYTLKEKLHQMAAPLVGEQTQ